MNMELRYLLTRRIAAVCAALLFAACVTAIQAQGIIQTVAGNGSASYGGDGGMAINAALNHARGIAVDSNGNIYIADTDNSRVRRVTPSGIITTFAGNGYTGASGDGGPATNAMISDVMAVAVD